MVSVRERYLQKVPVSFIVQSTTHEGKSPINWFGEAWTSPKISKLPSKCNHLLVVSVNTWALLF
jgi:hypothetical protein